jgi:hypothetical protein
LPGFRQHDLPALIPVGYRFESLFASLRHAVAITDSGVEK